MATLRASRELGQAMVANPAACVVYVDHDPIVLAHARKMLRGTPNAVIIGHDMRPEPGEQVLARPSDCHYYALVARKP